MIIKIPPPEQGRMILWENIPIGVVFVHGAHEKHWMKLGWWNDLIGKLTQSTYLFCLTTDRLSYVTSGTKFFNYEEFPNAEVVLGER